MDNDPLIDTLEYAPSNEVPFGVLYALIERVVALETKVKELEDG